MYLIMKRIICFVGFLLFCICGFANAQELRTHESFENGDVVVSPSARLNDGDMKRSSEPYQENVVAVYNSSTSTSKVPVFITSGIAFVKFDNSNGEVEKGDLITSSAKTGAAMKATSSGMVIGVALENSSKELLKIRVLPSWKE